MKKLKPFDLERAKKGDPVVYRCGDLPEEIIFPTKASHSTLCVATVHLGQIHIHLKDGFCNIAKQPCALDLFMVPKTKKLWIAVDKVASEKGLHGSSPGTPNKQDLIDNNWHEDKYHHIEIEVEQ